MNCALTECTSVINATGMCDPKIFISWIGTDRSGNTLISASNKITNFKNYNMAGMFNSILEVNTNNNATPDDIVRYDSAQIDTDVAKRIADPSAIIAEEKSSSSSETTTTTTTSTTSTSSTTDSTSTSSSDTTTTTSGQTR